MILQRWRCIQSVALIFKILINHLKKISNNNIKYKIMLHDKEFYIHMTLIHFCNPTEKGDKQIISNQKLFLHLKNIYCNQLCSYISKS